MDEGNGRPSTPSRIGGLEQLGRFELVCVLSRAEFGSTWAAVATAPPNLGGVFTLRRIVVGSADEPTAAKAITDAGEAWRGIAAPGSLPIVEVVSSPGRIGIASDYASAEPLRSILMLARLRKKAISQPVALRIATDLVQATIGLHGLALKHPKLASSLFGGVTPDTVLIGTNGETRITEPGVSAVIARLPSLARHEKLFAYRAPEQLERGGAADARTDVFVLGILIWELLAQRPLFGAEASAAEGGSDPLERIAKRVQQGPIPRLDDASLALDPPVGKPLADVVARALQQDASARFASAQELATSLRKAHAIMLAGRKEVGGFIEELVGSTLETRRAVVERATQGAPPAPVPFGTSEPLSGEIDDLAERAKEPGAEDGSGIDVDFGDDAPVGRESMVEEIEPELTDPKLRRPAPPPPPPMLGITRPNAIDTPPPPVAMPKSAEIAPAERSEDALPLPVEMPKPPAGVPSDATPAPLFAVPRPQAADKGPKDEAPAQSTPPSLFPVPVPSEPPAPSGSDDAATQMQQEAASDPDLAAAARHAAAAIEAFNTDAPGEIEVPPVPPSLLLGLSTSDEPPTSKPEPEHEPVPEPVTGETRAASQPDAPRTDEGIAETGGFEDQALTARKKKLQMIVGGVVGAGLLIVAIAVIASSFGGSGDADADATPPATLTPPIAVSTAAMPSAEPDAEAKAPEAGADAGIDAEAGVDAAPDAKPKPESAAPKGPSTPRPRPKPKPYVPSGI